MRGAPASNAQWMRSSSGTGTRLRGEHTPLDGKRRAVQTRTTCDARATGSIGPSRAKGSKRIHRIRRVGPVRDRRSERDLRRRGKQKQNAPGAGPAGPSCGYGIRTPGGGGAGNLRPRVTEIERKRTTGSALGRRHLTRRSTRLMQFVSSSSRHRSVNRQAQSQRPVPDSGWAPFPPLRAASCSHADGATQETRR